VSRRSAVEVLSRSATRRHGVIDLEARRGSQRRVWRGVRVGDFNLLLDARIQGEIQENLPIQPVPRSREFCLGLSNLRGNLVALYDIRHFLGELGAHQRWYLVLHTKPAWVGFGMDTLPDQLSLDESMKVAQLPPLPEDLEPFVKAGYRVADKLWLDLDFERFFEQLSARAVLALE